MYAIHTIGRLLKSASFDFNNKFLRQAVWLGLNFEITQVNHKNHKNYIFCYLIENNFPMLNKLPVGMG